MKVQPQTTSGPPAVMRMLWTQLPELEFGAAQANMLLYHGITRKITCKHSLTVAPGKWDSGVACHFNTMQTACHQSGGGVMRQALLSCPVPRACSVVNRCNPPLGSLSTSRALRCRGQACRSHPISSPSRLMSSVPPAFFFSTAY